MVNGIAISARGSGVIGRLPGDLGRAPGKAPSEKACFARLRPHSGHESCSSSRCVNDQERSPKSPFPLRCQDLPANAGTVDHVCQSTANPRSTSVSRNASRTPYSAQRRHRMKTEFHVAYRSCVSRQGQPARSTWSMPLRKRLLSTVDRPKRPRWGCDSRHVSAHSACQRPPRPITALQKAALEANLSKP